MNLFTRLIEEGIFIFWSDDNPNNTYNLKISLFNGDTKVLLINKEFDKDTHYFSISPLGSGDYEIELNGYSGGKLFQTETKKVSLKSSSQKTLELLEAINGIRNTIDTYSTHRILEIIENPNSLDADKIAKFLINLDNSKRWLRER